MKWIFQTPSWIAVVIIVTYRPNINCEAGFACISNPCVYGICIDDINSTYTCYCINGYTGIQCQTNWDECWSSPCLNGGTCIDGIAAYNCTCAEGFTGPNCELDINECASNPCTNNGTCIDIQNGFTCECHAGYSGPFCDIDMAVCNSSDEVRCHNGGFCIDGPGLTYTCDCQPGWTGALCENDINECASSPCQNGAVCIDLHADYSCACLFGYTGHSCETELELCELNLCANGALCLIEDDTRVCYCVPDYHGDRCQYQYDECSLRGRCYNGGTCIDGVDNYTCSCPPKITGFHCECIIDANGEEICDTTPSTHTVLLSTTTYETETSKIPSYTSEFTNISLPTTLSTYFDFYTTSSAETTVIHTTAPSTTISAREFPTTTTESKSESTTIETTTLQETTESVEETTQTLKIETMVPSTEYEATETTFESTIFHTTTMESRTRPRTTFSFSTEYSTSTARQPPTTALYFTTVPEGTTQSKFTTFDTTAKSTVILSNVTSPRTTTECCDISTFTEITEIVEDTERVTDLTTVTDDEWYKFFNKSTTVAYEYCSNITCLNGGKCYSTNTGPKCSCRFGWEGPQCEEAVTIKVVAFTGKSYLIHNLNNGTSTIVSLKLKTLSSFGIIFYAQVTSNMYMCLYVEDGFLKFQFSCGVQTMLFSETKYRINTGYQIQILATVSLNKNIQAFDEGECSAALRINNTVAMSGEQTTATTQRLLTLPALYIGGLPKYLIQQLDLPVTNGIIGCMHSLQIDGLPKDIYMDAHDGNEITECSSLACISNPCHHSATCIENGQSWTCLCPLGFVGDTCNISVCINNPCQFGATCVQYPTNGFLCLCPLGKHGLFCEQDLEITQPTFTSTVRGYSSFMAYYLPSSSVQHTFELRFKFIPETMEQIALLVFMGQKGQHDIHSDHLALSFIKGYIALTWNLGAGPRRIFTPRPISKKGKKMHSIRIGRTGSRAWLYVDGFKNITGRAAGRYMQLNVTPQIFIGGHESYNFATLPHDLPLHTGFAGCIYDVEMRTSHITFGLQKSQPVIGRSVAQCGTSECSNYTCQHGGACVQHGPTFSCLCPDGWFGPLCAYRHNLCDSNYHKCSAGSTCVPVALTYECDCPVGQTGKFCEKFESQLSDISFSGRRSYLLLQAQQDFQIKQFNFELEFKPLNDKALVMYAMETTSEFFTALVLKGGILEFRITTFGGSKKHDIDNEVIKVRSGTIINTGKWTKIRAGRFGQKLYLTVNGFTNSKIIPLDSSLTLKNISVYFGGIDNLADIPYEVSSGLPASFSGCIRQFFINFNHIILNESTILRGRNIADCDGTPCGADVCANGGTCWLNTTLRPHCMCPREYNGDRCQNQVSCAVVPCRNNGRCVEGSKGLTCHCPLGWIGPFCDKEMPSLTPFLGGDSYIIVDKKPSKKRQLIGNKTSTDLIHIKFSTTQENGLLLWNMKDQNFFGIGIENGNLKVVWSIDGVVNQYSLITNTTINNGIWHTVVLKFNDTEVLSFIDNEEIYLDNLAIKYFLTTDGLFYLGGFPDNKYVSNETNGIFTSNFNGCIKEFAWNEHTMVTNFRKYKGENVGSCFEYKG